MDAVDVDAKLARMSIGKPSNPTAVPFHLTMMPATDLPTPPFSPCPPEIAPESDSTAVSTAAVTFHPFPRLPAELRLKIWHFSFAPRAVELHARRAHYADGDDDDIRRGIGGGGGGGGSPLPRWQSRSRNPAALAVSAEARAAALEHYTVALPLLPLLHDRGRVLYVCPAVDTVVVLGELHFNRLTRLLDWFRTQDISTRGRGKGNGKGRGIRRLAMSAPLWAHDAGAPTLRAFSRTVFADLDEFVLFLYEAYAPPDAWACRGEGGCVLLDEVPTNADYYRRFVLGTGKQFRHGAGWMVVGKRPLKVADLHFVDGW